MIKSTYYTVVVFLSLALILWGCQDKYKSGNATTSEMSEPVAEASGTTLSQLVADSVQDSPSSESQAVVNDVDAGINSSRKTAITQAVQNVSPAVVSITVTEVVQGGRRLGIDEFNRFFSVPIEREVSSMGSGFIISKDGLVVTNQHVANQNAKKVVVSLPDGSQYEADVLGSDELADLALLRINADREFPTVEFGNSDSVMVGEWSLAVGNPFGLFQAAQPSVTVGVVSALHRDFLPNPTSGLFGYDSDRCSY